MISVIPRAVMVTNAIKCVCGMKLVMALGVVVLGDLVFVLIVMLESFAASVKKGLWERIAQSHARKKLIALVMDGAIMMACAIARIGMQVKIAPSAPKGIGVWIVRPFVITWRHATCVEDVRTLASVFANCPQAVLTVRIARTVFTETNARSRAIGTRPVIDMAAARRRARAYVSLDIRDQVWHSSTYVFPLLLYTYVLFLIFN